MRFAPSRSLSPSLPSRRSIALAFAALPLAVLSPAQAVGAPAFGADLARARAKVDAYAELLAVGDQMRSMGQRYARLVNPENGPTGHEASINDLHAPRDASRELATVQAEIERGPSLSECDQAMAVVVRLHGEMAPLVTGAADCYASGQHKQDGGEKAREYHARLRKVVPALLAACRDARTVLEPVREVVELAELAAHEPVAARTEAFGAAHPQSMIGFERSARNDLAAMHQARSRITAFPVEPKRWAPAIADVEVPFQGLLTFADAVLRNLG